MILTFAIIVLRYTYSLGLTTYTRACAVVATPCYLYACTRLNRAEGILIFSLVVGVCYISGKLICLQEELQRLNDIVFDNAMMQGIDQQTIHRREIMRRIDRKAT